MDTTNYKQTSFGLYVPAYIAEQINHLDMTTKEAKRAVLLQEWTRMIKQRQESGLI